MLLEWNTVDGMSSSSSFSDIPSADLSPVHACGFTGSTVLVTIFEGCILTSRVRYCFSNARTQLAPHRR